MAEEKETKEKKEDKKVETSKEKEKSVESKEKKPIKKLEDYKTLGENVKKENAEGEKEVSKVEGGKDVKPVDKKSKKAENVGMVVLERENVVPLRKGFQKVPRYKRAKKAIKTLREFIAKHMKVEGRDLGKVKVDKWLNQEIWFRGIKKPPAKIKVKATKDSEGIVKVELVDIPEKVKWDIAREKKKLEVSKKVETKKKPKEKPEDTKEEKEEKKEKEKASVEGGLKAQKEEAKAIKHTSKVSAKQSKHQIRKALKK